VWQKLGALGETNEDDELETECDEENQEPIPGGSLKFERQRGVFQGFERAKARF
jgi:hypothetical protein